MMVLEHDYLAARIISQGKEVPGYERICFSANEDLESSLKNLRIYDKAVLTVLASSDQLYTFNTLGVNADSFDINILTLYYYYYRRWSILYGEYMYPEELLKNERFTIGLILDKVKPQNEEEKTALEFWRRLVNSRTNFDNLFFYTDRTGRTMFDERDDLKAVVLNNPNFCQMDLFKPVFLNKTYDIVYLSNIIEWARGDSIKLETIRDNLDRLLNPDGIAICTNIISRMHDKVYAERRLFRSKFEVAEDDRFSYRYVKKR